MYVSGFSSPTRCSSIRTSANWPENLLRHEPPCRARQLVDDHVADVVAVARVLATRVAETDDQQVERRGAFAPAPREAQGSALVGGGFAGGFLAALGCSLALGRGLLALGRGLSSPSAPSPSSSTRVGCVTLASTVSSGSSRNVTPAGASISARRSDSPICSAETSISMCCGTSSGSASTLTSFTTCESTPPSLVPAASPTSVTTTAVWIGWSRRTSWRSMCVIVPRTLSRW